MSVCNYCVFKVWASDAAGGQYCTVSEVTDNPVAIKLPNGTQSMVHSQMFHAKFNYGNNLELIVNHQNFGSA